MSLHRVCGFVKKWNDVISFISFFFLPPRFVPTPSVFFFLPHSISAISSLNHNDATAKAKTRGRLRDTYPWWQCKAKVRVAETSSACFFRDRASTWWSRRRWTAWPRRWSAWRRRWRELESLLFSSLFCFQF